MFIRRYRIPGCRTHFPAKKQAGSTPFLLRFLPHVACNVTDESELGPLLLLGEFVPDLAGSKSALRRQAEPVQRNQRRSLADSGFHRFRIFQFRSLRGDQSENDFLALRNQCERIKTTGTLVVLLEIEGVNVLLCEEVCGNVVVCTAACEGRVIIAAAHMGCNREIGRPSLERGIVYLKI